jgi:chemotaxis protein methyltransferase CheR
VTHPEEWAAFDDLCHVTISRFYRDRGVFAALEREVVPELARGRRELRAWSAGCASGEEAYTLALMWELALAPRFPGLRFSVLATDVDDAVLARAREACYGPGSLRDLPEGWRRGLVEHDGLLCVRPEIKRRVAVSKHDVRAPAPGGPFDLVLCRNLAFTYFDSGLQLGVARLLAESLRPGGALVVGAHETLPEGAGDFEPWPEAPSVYRRLEKPRA